MEFRARDHWIFDLDGTLTVAAHDFEEIQRILGMAPGASILETLRSMPPDAAAPLWKALEDWEMDVARRARPAPFAARLLEGLARRGARAGILTRNSRKNAEVTLAAAGLERFFTRDAIVTRDDAPPKPRPDGILALLERWRAERERVVMVGDFVYDLEAGRAAGVYTIHYDVEGVFEWPAHTDHAVRCLSELLHDDAS